MFAEIIDSRNFICLHKIKNKLIDSKVKVNISDKSLPEVVLASLLHFTKAYFRNPCNILITHNFCIILFCHSISFSLFLHSFVYSFLHLIILISLGFFSPFIFEAEHIIPFQQLQLDSFHPPELEV